MTVGTGLKAFLLVSLIAFFVPSVAWAGPVDTDGDNVTDDIDNCILAPNPDQTDSDGDLCGNGCDADYDQSGETSEQATVGIQDFGIFQQCFASVCEAICDHTGSTDPPGNPDGLCGIQDFGVFQQQFVQGVAGPGQSELCNGL